MPRRARTSNQRWAQGRHRCTRANHPLQNSPVLPCGASGILGGFHHPRLAGLQHLHIAVKQRGIDAAAQHVKHAVAEGDQPVGRRDRRVNLAGQDGIENL